MLKGTKKTAAKKAGIKKKEHHHSDRELLELIFEQNK